MSDRVAPRSILIAALGGEGGGVFANWIVEAALRAGLPVQATSVPGVAQRTGATSYYIEFLADAETATESGARDDAPRPVFALMPVPGRVDIVVASELLEGVRMIERGFVDDQRTTLITARHRVLTTKEKMAMGDGRVDDERLFATAASAAARCIAIDMREIAQRHRTVISAVMYGALAGSGRLPWGREIDEAVIRAGGTGVEASLAGFDEGWSAAAAAASADSRRRSPDPDTPEAGAAAPLSPALADIVARGEARARDFQDDAWARLYRSRVDSLRDAAGDAAQSQPALEEAARQLALWMSYEDIARVADLKTRAARFERVRAEAQAAHGDIVTIHEHLSPGLDEIAAIAPARLGRWLRRQTTRPTPIGARGRGMRLATSSIHGFVLLRLLSLAARWRRKSLRFVEEQAAIEIWLGALEKALPRHAGFAEALAGLPRLRKGYSDTFERGRANHERIHASRVAPVGEPDDAAATALRAAIAAALADPESASLGRVLADAAPASGVVQSSAPARPPAASTAGSGPTERPIQWQSLKRTINPTEGDNR